MSLEQTVADLIAVGTQNMALPQQIATAAQAQISAIGQAYTDRVGGLATTFYVNQTLGNDNNSGLMAALPLATIGKALSLTPLGGRCNVILQTDYLVSGANIVVRDRRVRIGSDTSVRRNITFERVLAPGGSNGYRQLRGFDVRGRSQLVLSGVRVTLPVADGGYAAAEKTYFTPAFQISDQDEVPLTQIALSNCDIDIPASAFGSLIGQSGGIVLYAYSVVAITSALPGRLFDTQTNTAGVASTTLPWLVTNLATV